MKINRLVSGSLALIVLLPALNGEAQTVADTFRRTGVHEYLIVPFTSPATATRNSYSGNVEVIVSGTGTSYGDLVNDAFYGVPSGIPVDYYGVGSVFDIPWYQLNLGWGEEFGCGEEGNNINNFITFIDAVGPVSPPAMPAYDPIGNSYHFVVSTAADSEPLIFGVSDCHFEDNSGAYHVETFQLEPGSMPSPTIPLPTPVPTLGVTPLLGVVIGTAAGRQGHSAIVPVSLNMPAQSIVALQADIAFEAQVPVAAGNSGQPLCEVNVGIDKPDSSFTFLPPGCVPGVDCMGVRAVIVAFDEIQEIPDGATLFSCAVDIEATADPRTYALGCSRTRGSDENGAAVALGCTAGWVAVIPPESVVVGSGSGAPNEPLQVPVFLNSATQEVAAVQLDLLFSSRVSIASRSNQRPDCRVETAIGKPGSQFSFLPSDCVPGVDCTAVRALIYDFDNLGPIADGSILFHCAAKITPTGAPARYSIGCSGALGSDSLGRRIDLACVDGAITVSQGCPGDCDGDGRVTVDELLHGVSALLGRFAADCEAFDVNLNGEVTIEELLRGVIGALNGCR